MPDRRLFFVGIPQAHVKASIGRAQRLGYEVVLGDTEENLCRRQALVAGADRLVITDYTCTETLLASARQLDRERRLDAIVTFKEAGSVQTAQVAQKLGLVTNDPEALAACNDKSQTHAALRDAGLPTPQWAMCADINQLRDFVAEVGPRVVVKPHDLQGSVGVHLVGPGTDLEAAFADCLSLCQSPTILAEEFLIGREVSIEAMVYQGRTILFGVTEKLLYPGTFVECGHLTPDPGAELGCGQYKSLVTCVTRALGITLGPLHIEGFHTERGFVLTEVHSRYGGDQIVGITEAAAKCDMTSPVFAELDDIPYEVTFGRPAETAGIRFFDVAPGRVLTINGVAEAEAVPGVTAVSVECCPGDEVRPIRSSFDRTGWAIAQATSRPALIGALDEALRRVRVITR